jgi:Icc-related predicted phosphoesterase
VTARPAQWAIRFGYVATAFGLVSVVALSQLGRWEGSTEPGTVYPMPGHDALSFSSPQAREVAVQVEPFITKMSTRLRERSASYLQAARASADTVLRAHAVGLAPRDGEVVVLAEADPQGSQVASELRSRLYPLLDEVVGGDAVVLRTIAGDVTSNGTVAERGFVRAEAAASGDVPTVAVKGDHDSAETLDQLRAAGARALDLEVAGVGGLRVAGASDPASKTLFGGISTNESGTSEAEVGQDLRTVVDEELDPLESVVVVLHQPRAVAGYLGVGSVTDLAGPPGHDTVPYDDGVPDVPPGMVTIGHLHDADGPWVLWNTDGDEVTWTVVSQLGTSGGVEESPTFNRFSTPFSVPLKDVSVRVCYVNPLSGLQTGYASIVVGTDGAVSINDRVDVGLPGGLPAPASAVRLALRRAVPG